MSTHFPNRHRELKAKRLWRTTLAVTLPVLGLLLLYFLTPAPGPRSREVAISDGELKNLVDQLRVPRDAPILRRETGTNVTETRLANFGQALFAATNLSPSGDTSCLSCHSGTGNQVNQTITKDHERLALPLVNLAFSTWFGSSGEADSIGAAALAALENPNHMRSSRLYIIKQMLGPWRSAYKAAFGSFPALLNSKPETAWPAHGLPDQPALTWPVESAATGLATLGDGQLLEQILNQAIQDHIAPAVEISRLAFTTSEVNPEWLQAYRDLTPAEADAVNTVFANVGRALAAYLASLVAFDSPFDRFADRWQQGMAVTSALGDGFGTDELNGLNLFVGPGQCLNCHSGSTLSDGEFHNLGLSQRGGAVASGRAVGAARALVNPFNCLSPYQEALTGQIQPCPHITSLNANRVKDLGAFKTPSLRNVATKSHFFHDQRDQSLETVLTYLNHPTGRPAIGQLDDKLEPLELTNEELRSLMAFLGALSSPVRDLNEKSRS